MKIRKLQRGLLFAAIAAGTLAAGCELLVDFDRTKIPVEVTDGATSDVAAPDGNVVPPAADASASDASDASNATDASNESDGSVDSDAGVDSSSGATDASDQ